ncbi:MAG TPA: GNAT family N-acetyltransferase [Solirubrobacterales bacterium]
MRTAHRAHLNLVDSSRQLFELDSGAAVVAEEGCLLGAGSSDNPAISNAAFRVDDDLDPVELLRRAREFFGARGRGFSLWTRGNEPEDRDLLEVAREEGLSPFFEMPEMVMEGRAEQTPFPDDVELRRLRDAEDAAHYWRVARESYTSVGFPPEVFDHYDDHSGLVAENAVALLAYRGAEPVAIAMTIVTDGVAGIYWVGTADGARGKGLGRAITAAAVNAGFDLGADLTSLQASPMGEPIYRTMGFETIYDYRLLMAAAPQETGI